MIEQVSISVRNSAELMGMLKDIVDRAWFSEGKYCQAYSDLIRKTLNRKHVFLAPNGTLGLYLALLVMREHFGKKGGDVLVPSFTFYGSAMSVVHAGFRPVFVDCSPTNFQSSLADFKAAWTAETVGVMPIHIYGQVGEVADICQWARSENLFSVEDAAQAFGCFKNGQPAGTFADIGVFSTFSDKIYTTGEGSILTTGDDEIAQKIRLTRNQGRPNAGTFIHPELGMNFRMTEFQAALGLHQLSSLDLELEERLGKYRYYESKFKNNPGVQGMEICEGSTLVPFRYPLLSENRDALTEKLNAANVQTRNFFVPMHMQPKFISDSTNSLPNAELVSRTGMCLPIHHNITPENIDLIASVVNA